MRVYIFQHLVVLVYCEVVRQESGRMSPRCQELLLGLTVSCLIVPAGGLASPPPPRSPPAQAPAASRRAFTAAMVAHGVGVGWPHPVLASPDSSTLVATSTLPGLPVLTSSDHFRLFLLRHGETEYNRLGLAQGRRVDAELNDQGRRQAAAARDALAPIDIGHGFSSNLQRSIETTQVIIRPISLSRRGRVRALL